MIKYGIRFFALIIVQVVILSDIKLHHIITPQIYPLFILLLPVSMAHWIVILLGFLMGLTVDMFYDTGGIHGAATLLLAWSRVYILRFIAPRDGYETHEEPGLPKNGLRWFTLYVAICLFIHHSAYFGLQVLSFTYFGYLLLKVFLNIVFSFMLIILGSMLFYPRPRTRIK